MKGADVVKVKCSPTELVVNRSKTVQSRMENLNHICYLPDVKCIVFSFWPDHVVKAIHCEKDEIVWEVKGEVAGVPWEPCGLFDLPEHQSLLVCDASDKGRLVVLNPRDGSIRQKIPLPNLGTPYELFAHKSSIILHSGFTTGRNIHVFIIE